MGVTFDGMGRFTAPSRLSAVPDNPRSLGFARDDRVGDETEDFPGTFLNKVLVIPTEVRDELLAAVLPSAASSHGVEETVVASPPSPRATFFLPPAPELQVLRWQRD
jgi:hypothetical protein